MTLADAAAGLGVVIPVTVTSVVTGIALRRWALPRWAGAHAALAATVLGLSGLLTVAHLLGAAGQLRPAPVVGGCVLLAVGAAYVAVTRAPVADPGDRPTVPAEPAEPRAPIETVVRVCAIALVALVLAQWAYGLADTLRSGMASYDSIDYHLPIAARFAHTGEILPLHFILPDTGTFTFHPADAELINAIGMLGWSRDVLVPYLNFGWLAALLLAGWCFARQRSAAVFSLMATALVLCVPIFAHGQAGTALNDLPALFGLVAAGAILVHGRDDPRAYAVAGLAGGIALGAKLTVLIPIAVLTVAVPLLHRRRLAMTGAWLGGLVVTGAFWYVRNLVVAGSPLPAAKLPFFPHAEMPLLEKRGWSVSHYLFDAFAWRDLFPDGMRGAFGWLWPVLAVAVVAGVVVALRRGATVDRVLAVVAVLSLLGYLVTPTTALGAEGRPSPPIFAFNLRYAAPGMLLGLLLLADVSSRWSPSRRRWAAGGVLAVAAAAQTTGFIWRDADRYVWTATAAGALVGLVPLLVRRRPPRLAIAAVALLGTVAVVGVDMKLDPPPYDPLAQWAANVSDARIAMGGIRKHYALTGPTLDNTVDYVGRRLDHGTFAAVTDCRTWRRIIAEGDYDYVVTFDSFPLDVKPDSWTDGPGAVLEVKARNLRIWRLDAPPDPDLCP